MYELLAVALKDRVAEFEDGSLRDGTLDRVAGSLMVPLGVALVDDDTETDVLMDLLGRPDEEIDGDGDCDGDRTLLEEAARDADGQAVPDDEPLRVCRTLRVTAPDEVIQPVLVPDTLRIAEPEDDDETVELFDDDAVC